MKAVYGKVILYQEKCKTCGSLFFPDKKEKYCSYCIDAIPEGKRDKGNEDLKNKVIVKIATERRRINLSKYTKERIYKRDEGLCVFCSVNVWGKQWAIDHFVPVRYGGSNKDENLNVACYSCHKYKRALVFQDIAEAREYIKRRKAEKRNKEAKRFLKESRLRGGRSDDSAFSGNVELY